ncbi:MAG: hypothetical protein MUC31_08335 [Bacteroidales bacterium]|jgi:hypothetical protein|nr:hypothetical protein [Bacteroidales bacterium]
MADRANIFNDRPRRISVMSLMVIMMVERFPGIWCQEKKNKKYRYYFNPAQCQDDIFCKDNLIWYNNLFILSLY